MGQRWLGQLGWCVAWAVAFFVVQRWGMWWCFRTAGGLASACGVLLWRSLRCLSPASPPVRVASPRRVRRIIIEEEVL